MICPDCEQRLVIVEVNGVELDMCYQQHGMWFDHDELRQLFLGTCAPETLTDLESRLERLPRKGGPKRRCPRCRAKMWQVVEPNGADVILDACPHDHGLWFDQGELEAILDSHFGVEDDELQSVKDHLGLFTKKPSDVDAD
jgi:Zn-finger nucleic acid-binding protein